MRGGASRATESDANDCVENGVPPVHAAWARTTDVCVVFTSRCVKRSAARVARDLARALTVPLTFIVFRRASQGGQTTPAPHQDDEVEALVKELRANGQAVTTRVYVCHSVRQAIPFADNVSLLIGPVFFLDKDLQPGGGEYMWSAQLDVDIPLGR